MAGSRFAVWLELETREDARPYIGLVDAVIWRETEPRGIHAGASTPASFVDLGAEHDLAAIQRRLAVLRRPHGVVLPALDAILAEISVSPWRHGRRLAVDVYSAEDYLVAALFRADYVIAQDVRIGRAISSMSAGRSPAVIARAFSPADVVVALDAGADGVSVASAVLSLLRSGEGDRAEQQLRTASPTAQHEIDGTSGIRARLGPDRPQPAPRPLPLVHLPSSNRTET